MKIYVVINDTNETIEATFYYKEGGQEDLVKDVFCEQSNIDPFKFDENYSIEEYNGIDLKNAL